MKKFGILAAVLVLAFGLQARAWVPTGWVYQQGSYSYSLNEGGWYFSDPIARVWCNNLTSGAWTPLDQSPVASGWNYYQYPYVYSYGGGSWFYCHISDVRVWCYSFSQGLWSEFGEIPRPNLLLIDNFVGGQVSGNVWHIPTWVSPTDGTFIGRTQFRCSQDASLPAIVGGNAVIAIDTFNPTGGSFYGTDLISNEIFSRGIAMSVIAKMAALTPGGIVGGIFLYAPPSGFGSQHDEIDFEMLSNDPYHIWTNIYGNEPLGGGNSVRVDFPFGGSIFDPHRYEIKWLDGRVSWYIDGVLVRTVTTQSPLPAGPMYLHFNVWAPGSEFSDAYNSGLNWVNSASQNQTYSMRVDSASIYGE